MCDAGDFGETMYQDNFFKELMLAQGFPIDYVLDIESRIGKKYSEAKQIARLGNAVCPPVATAIVRANCTDIAAKRAITTMKMLNIEFNKSLNGKLPI